MFIAGRRTIICGSSGAECWRNQHIALRWSAVLKGWRSYKHLAALRPTQTIRDH